MSSEEDVNALISGDNDNNNSDNKDAISSDNNITNNMGDNDDNDSEPERMTSTSKDMNDKADEYSEDEVEGDHDGDYSAEEEEEEEPVLKYSRVGGSLASTIFKSNNNDSASTLNVCEDYIVIGTHYGIVYVLSLDGDVLKKFNAHTATVNSIAIDSEKEYIGSASVDGRSFNLYHVYSHIERPSYSHYCL